MSEEIARKALSDKEIYNISFREGKYNVAPDDPRCKECGRCCVKYQFIKLFPLDFKREDIEEELRYLLDLGILGFDTRDWGSPALDLRNGCPFLSDTGCRLAADKRPLICGHWLPKIDSINRKYCRGEWSEWYLSFSKDQRNWSFNEIKILEKLKKEYPNALRY